VNLLHGSYPQTMDDRKRLPVPAKMIPTFRELCGIKGNEPIEVVVSITPQKRIGVYPRRVFMEMIAELAGPAKTDREVYKLRNAYLQYMDEQSLDKQNRVRIPGILAEAFDLKGEVVAMGAGDMFEVITKDAWKSQLLADADRMDRGAEKLAMILDREEERVKSVQAVK
jgi:division/cell wall cluster transcriptional repressor MraZ